MTIVCLRKRVELGGVSLVLQMKLILKLDKVLQIEQSTSSWIVFQVSCSKSNLNYYLTQNVILN